MHDGAAPIDLIRYLLCMIIFKGLNKYITKTYNINVPYL